MAVTARTGIGAGALAAAQGPLSLSSAGAGTGSQCPPCALTQQSGGSCGWKVECSPHVAASLRQLTELQRCSCEPFTHYPLSYPGYPV